MKPDVHLESMQPGPTLPPELAVLGPAQGLGPSEVSHLEPGWAPGKGRARLGCPGSPLPLLLSLPPPPFLPPPPPPPFLSLPSPSPPPSPLLLLLPPARVPVCTDANSGCASRTDLGSGRRPCQQGLTTLLSPAGVQPRLPVTQEGRVVRTRI